MDAQPAYYEDQIVQTVRRLPFHRQLEALRLLRQMERRERLRERPEPEEVEEGEVDETEHLIARLPRFMQEMIAEGKLQLSNLGHYVPGAGRHSEERLKAFRKYLLDNKIFVPIEEYIRAERSKR